MKHFEELWENCEQFHQTHGSTQATVSSIVEAISLKLNLYKAIHHGELSNEDAQQAKSRILGEILMTLTQLSLQDNINVFESLQTALHYHTVDQLSQKY